MDELYILSSVFRVVNVSGPFLAEIEKLDLADHLIVSTSLPTSLS